MDKTNRGGYEPAVHRLRASGTFVLEEILKPFGSLFACFAHLYQ